MTHHIRPAYAIITILLSCSRDEPSAQSVSDTLCDYTCNDVDAPDDAVYVRAGASGGDGSAKNPLSTINEGIEVALDQGSQTVIVEPGTYPEQLSFGPEHDGLSVIGTCTDTVIIDGSNTPITGPFGGRASIHAEGTSSDYPPHIKGLSIVGAAIGALTHPSGSLSLSYVDISGSRTTGVNALGRGTLSVACSTIRDGDPQGSSYGLGVMAQGQGADTPASRPPLSSSPA
jgi:hypothetical protein